MMEHPTSNIQIQNQIPKNNKIFDLRERLFRFSKMILALTRLIPSSPEHVHVKKQLAKAGTAIGANFEEADGALTRKDFINKVAIARKEAKEAKYWLKLISESYGKPKHVAAQTMEAEEIIRILSTILIKSGYKFRL